MNSFKAVFPPGNIAISEQQHSQISFTNSTKFSLGGSGGFMSCEKETKRKYQYLKDDSNHGHTTTTIEPIKFALKTRSEA